MINLDGGFVHPEGIPIPIPILVGNAGTQNHYVASSQHGFMDDDDEDIFNAFYVPAQMRPAVGVLLDLVVKRLYTLKEKFKSSEVHITPDLDDIDMCLVLGLVIPQKFKVLDFDKYKRVSCPQTHLRAYCRKMTTHINNDKLFIHYFQNRLNEASLEWYI